MSIRQKLSLVVKATRQHARNLASFAFLYKTIVLLLKSSRYQGRSTEKEASYDTLVAGLLSGYLVFGRGIQSSVNQQIVIYVFGRVVLAVSKLMLQKQHLVPPHVSRQLERHAWPIFASTSWGLVMWLFRWHPDTLQPSLRSSMKYM